MKKLSYVGLILLLAFGLSGCHKKVRSKPVKQPVQQQVKQPVKTEVLTKRAQELSYAFGYAMDDTVVPALQLDNAKQRSGYITLSNSGEEDLELNSIEVQKPVSGLYNVKNNCKKMLKQNDSCQVFVHFSGEKEGFYTQNIMVYSNDIQKPKLLLRAEAKATKNISITQFSISKNIKQFLEDRSKTSRDYYTRIVFQTAIDDVLRNEIKNELDKALKANNYKKTDKTYEANKLVILYATINISELGKTEYAVEIAMNGKILTKDTLSISAIKKSKRIGYLNEDFVTATDVTESTKEKDFAIYIDNGDNHTQSSTQNSQNTTLQEVDAPNIEEKDFAFHMKISAIHQEDKKKMYQKISALLAQSTVNVLGLEK